MRDAKEVMAQAIWNSQYFDLSPWEVVAGDWHRTADAVLAALTAAGYELHPVGTGESLARLRAVALAGRADADGPDPEHWSLDAEDELARALYAALEALTDADLGREPQ